MTTRITIGRGYRRLKPGERLRKGDEFCTDGRWIKTICYPLKSERGAYWIICSTLPYRRRKAKKEAK